MNTKSTVDTLEVTKFAQHANVWWDTDGPLKTLHDINPIRLEYIQNIMSSAIMSPRLTNTSERSSTSLANKRGEIRAEIKRSPLKNQRILDIGCGGGILSEGMAQCGGIVTGLDVEPDAIASARAHATQSQLNIHYECMPIEMFNATPFSMITCLEMLEHVQNPELVIQHAARLLAPGGYLFLSTINRTIKAYATVVIAAEYLLEILPRQTHDFKKFIKPSELASMTRSVGLELVGMSGIAYNPFTRIASLDQSVATNYLLVCRARGMD